MQILASLIRRDGTQFPALFLRAFEEEDEKLHHQDGSPFEFLNKALRKVYTKGWVEERRREYGDCPQTTCPDCRASVPAETRKGRCVVCGVSLNGRTVQAATAHGGSR
jgi:hypothetical protein